MQRKRFLLINPWVYDFAAVNMWARPLGLLRVAEFLSQFDVEILLLDCMDRFRLKGYNMGKYPKLILPTPEPLLDIKRYYGRYGIGLDEFIQRLRSSAPVDMILVTSLMTYWYPGVFEVIRLCRRFLPGVPVVLGGIYATLCHEHAKAFSGADYVYRGRISHDFADLTETMGIRLTGTGNPVPYYRLNLYRNPPYAPLLTSEGCPYRCSYCASGLLSDSYSTRPVDEIVQEIRQLHSLGVKDLAFYDDALLFRAEEHIKPLLHEIIREGLDVRFHTPNGLHARYLDSELADLMYRAGFKTIRLSLETVNPERQGLSGGKVRNDELDRAIFYLRKAGFRKENIGVYLMYGLPGQDIEEVAEGVEYLISRDVRIHLAEYSPIPGTRDWEILTEKGIIHDDIDPLLTNNTVFSVLCTNYAMEELRRIKERVNYHNLK